MFQGWTLSNNPQAKALTTVPSVAWNQGMVPSTVSLGNLVTCWRIEILPLHAGPCRGGPNTSLATCGIVMENSNLNLNLQH